MFLFVHFSSYRAATFLFAFTSSCSLLVLYRVVIIQDFIHQYVAKTLCYMLLFSINTVQPWVTDHCVRAHKWLKYLLLAYPEQAFVSGGRRLSLSPDWLPSLMFYFGMHTVNQEGLLSLFMWYWPCSDKLKNTGGQNEKYRHYCLTKRNSDCCDSDPMFLLKTCIKSEVICHA